MNNLGNIWSTSMQNKSQHKNINVKSNLPKFTKRTENIKINVNDIFSHQFNRPRQLNSRLSSSQSKPISQSEPQSNISNLSKNRNAKAYWGTPTWYLFHSIAAKINEDYYKNNYNFIWGFIKKTCSLLPCPYCKSHAISYVSKIKDSQINTKEKLINILYNFHNHANKNSGTGQYPKNKLDIYKKSNMNKIFNLFKARFFTSYFGTRYFQDWTKVGFKSEVIDFINKTKNNYN
jgi:hypothetical protein